MRFFSDTGGAYRPADQVVRIEDTAAGEEPPFVAHCVDQLRGACRVPISEATAFAMTTEQSIVPASPGWHVLTLRDDDRQGWFRRRRRVESSPVVAWRVVGTLGAVPVTLGGDVEAGAVRAPDGTIHD